MENTIENAQDFFDNEVGINASLGYREILAAKFPEMLVAYASQTAPKLVLPSEDYKQALYLIMYPDMEEEDGFDDTFLEAWSAYESAIKELNPHITDPGYTDPK